MIDWRKLEVHGEDGFIGHLGELLDDAPANFDSLELADDGSMSIWPQHFTCALGEDPAWDTPRVPVDWTGFADAFAAARRACSGDAD